VQYADDDHYSTEMEQVMATVFKKMVSAAVIAAVVGWGGFYAGAASAFVSEGIMACYAYSLFSGSLIYTGNVVYTVTGPTRCTGKCNIKITGTLATEAGHANKVSFDIGGKTYKSQLVSAKSSKNRVSKNFTITGQGKTYSSKGCSAGIYK
jgi:hypothetical protein